jgi:hypothetical protein
MEVALRSKTRFAETGRPKFGRKRPLLSRSEVSRRIFNKNNRVPSFHPSLSRSEREKRESRDKPESEWRRRVKEPDLLEGIGDLLLPFILFVLSRVIY